MLEPARRLVRLQALQIVQTLLFAYYLSWFLLRSLQVLLVFLINLPNGLIS